ncbi:IclR family transcriptional regulator [Yinghuangia sp. YIM S09857]|uniref:IclR family transcriptional regulator n=1 Tax=Yinghuangia sp. YIM S09857 TaxID=3436929 RepID=UPI003F5352BC
MPAAQDRDAWSAMPSPPTDRVVAVVEFLASRPAEPATVAELVRHLGFNRATCHAVLAALVRSGWVLRDPAEKTFTPGPALIALGRAAESGVPAARAADGELAALARDLGLTATISYPSGDHIVVGSRSPAVPGSGDTVRVGQRFPFAPPYGPGLIAWGTADDVDRWLARAPRTDDTGIRRFHDALASVRRRGYTVESMTAASRRLGEVLAELDSLSPRQRPAVDELLHEIGGIEYLDDNLRDGHTYPISVMSAPAFAGDGTAALNVSVYVWADLDPPAIRAVGNRLLAASHAVTRELRGTAPKDFPATRRT